MEKKQTAVQWLTEKLTNSDKKFIDLYELLIEEALKIETEQIINAYNQDLYGGLSGNSKFDNGEDYFFKTFKP